MLRRHRVRFVVVGEVAAVIKGAPIATFDIDVVPDRDATNIDRLVVALAELKAYYRGRPHLRPASDALRGPGHHLLMTRYGPLDVFGGHRERARLSRIAAALAPSGSRRDISPSARPGNADRRQRGT